jgi:hypothetical protein
MPRPDEGLIHAWLDGELSPAEAARVEQLVRDDAEWSAAAAEARGLVAAASRILGALDDVPGDVMPRGSRAAGGATGTATRERTKPPLRFAARPWVRAAAGVVLVVGTTVAVRSVQQEPVPVADSAMSGGIAATERQERAADADAPAASGATEPDAPVAKASVPQSALPPSPTAAPPTVPQAALPTATELAREVAPQTALAEVQASKETEARARAQLEMRAQRSEPTVGGRRASDRSLSAPASVSGFAARSALAPQALAQQILAGCWRRESAGTQDTLLTALAIVRTNGDSLELRLDTEDRIATVLRTADTLRGMDRRITGTTAPFVAVRVECP